MTKKPSPGFAIILLTNLSPPAPSDASVDPGLKPVSPVGAAKEQRMGAPRLAQSTFGPHTAKS